MYQEINISRTEEYMRIKAANDIASINKSIKNVNIRKSNSYKRFVSLLFITLGLILLLFLLIKPQNVNAMNTEKPIYYKYFHTYTVKEGDSLWKIANSYAIGNINDYINEVMKINHKCTENIKAGDMLVIPYYSTEYME